MNSKDKTPKRYDDLNVTPFDITRLKILATDERETDILRLNDLAEQHCLTFTQIRTTYHFEEYTAHGLRQALGFVEGYDRAVAANQKDSRDA